jgi:hypothetical protein
MHLENQKDSAVSWVEATATEVADAGEVGDAGVIWGMRGFGSFVVGLFW